MTDREKRDPQAARTEASRFTRAVVDLLLFASAAGLAWMIAASALDRANTRRDLKLLSDEALRVYDAFERYRERNHGYPSTYIGERFDLETLDPLTARGYYDGPITTYLAGSRVDAYDSPDDRGPDREFWLEMTLRSDPPCESSCRARTTRRWARESGWTALSCTGAERSSR